MPLQSNNQALTAQLNIGRSLGLRFPATQGPPLPYWDADARHLIDRAELVTVDMALQNILLTREYAAKIADVGWAQILYHSYITGDGGTFNWAVGRQALAPSSHSILRTLHWKTSSPWSCNNDVDLLSSLGRHRI